MPTESAKNRIRDILRGQLDQARRSLSLMEIGKISTHEIIDGREVNTTDQSVASRKADIESLTIALNEIDRIT